MGITWNPLWAASQKIPFAFNQISIENLLGSPWAAPEQNWLELSSGASRSLYRCPDWFINWILMRIWWKLSSGSFQISAAEPDFLQKWIWIMICTELSSSISRSPLQLSRLLSLRNQLNLNKDLIGTELKKLPDLLYSCPDWFPLEINWIWIRTCMELSSSISGSPLKLPRLISSRHQLKLNKDLIGLELTKLPDLVYSCRDWFPWEMN